MTSFPKAHSMRVVDALHEAETLLRNTRVTETPRLDSEVLLADALGVDRARLIASHLGLLAGPERTRYFSHVLRRSQGEPVAYIIGTKEFMGYAFCVDRRVLIPRPETETLVEHVVRIVTSGKRRDCTALDIGTGSGCIAISLALFLPRLAVHAVDLSSEAIEVAGINAEKHGVADRITFHTGDLYAALPGSVKESFGFIVSNPPYVSDADYGILADNVRLYEPSVALRSGPDGLDLISRIVAKADQYLVKDGFLAIEVGETQAEIVSALIRATGALEAVEIVADLSGKPRIVVSRRV